MHSRSFCALDAAQRQFCELGGIDALADELHRRCADTAERQLGEALQMVLGRHVDRAANALVEFELLDLGVGRAGG